MKMVFRIACLLMVVSLASAATYQGRLPMKPKEFQHRDGCYVQEINDVIPFGQEITPNGFCFSIECSRHRIYYNSCGTAISEDPSCHVTNAELNSPYPDCCPRIKCDADNNV